MSRKEEGGGLASIEYSEEASIREFKDYIKKSKERLITATRSSTGNIKINKTTLTRKKNGKEKQLYAYFKQQTNDISHEKTWTMAKKRKLKERN